MAAPARGKVMQRCAAAFPDLATLFNTIADLHQRKLYHQMTEALLALSRDKTFVASPLVRDVYDELVAPLAALLNGRSHARLAVLAAKHYASFDDSVAFLERVSKDLQPVVTKDTSRAVAPSALSFVWVYPLTAIATMRLAKGERAKAKDLLDQVGAVLEGVVELDSVVHSAFFLAKAEYHKLHGPAEAFYRNSLLYLACVDQAELSKDEQCVIAFELCLAALVSERLYTFGELLSHPVLGTLGEHSWIADLVRTVHNGDAAGFNDIKKRKAARMNKQRSLVLKQDLLDEKVAVAALINLLFSLPVDNRTISFANIAERAQCPLNKVETLVMRAFSLELVRGSIDQIAATVSVAWIAPRVVDTTVLASMTSHMAAWVREVDGAIALVEEETPELFA